jgi:hypothetical protein
MIAKYGITDIADIGAGDMNWAQHTEFGCAYRGYDLVPRHPDVERLNLLTDPLPETDCMMVMWVLHHFPAQDQAVAIARLVSSGARYLIMTWAQSMEPCTDLPHIEKAVLRKTVADGADLEIRLCKL